MKSRAEMEIELVNSVARACHQDFSDLEAAWPVSKRGSRAQRALDSLKGRVQAIQDCSMDALKAIRDEPE